MHLRIITRFIAILSFFLGLSMAGPLLVSLIYKDTSAHALFLSMCITTSISIILFIGTRTGHDVHLTHRDGVMVVTLGWVMAGLFGTLPYLLSGTIPDFTNAYFESISGFTTTGASILNNIEGLPEGILLWRSLTQWLGGMGIIVLSIAILPFLGIGGMQLYRAEIPSPVVDKLKPRISETAKTLWKVYLLITAVEVVLLVFGGMSLFDSVCHAFCTMPTGGFSTKNVSIAHFNSAYFDAIFIVFMLLAGINFSLHYRMLKGDFRVFGRDSECRVFLLMAVAFTLIVTVNIYGSVCGSIAEAFRQAAFHVSSILTTTGFVTADYEKWPALSQIILLGCMFLGGMAGSTGGGMKTMRIMLLIRHGYTEVFRIIHPHAVTAVKLGGKAVQADILSSIWGFFVLYIGLFLIASLIMASLGLDIISAFASVAASIGNIGPGLGVVGPVKNFFGIPLAGKWVLIFCMLLGRLEIYTVIVLMAPAFWHK
ncbi:MAG: TrkH family potassium uptake protein [Deltaproteobacteria bacterium]|nr:TrkH family potassium uptake protein [Deltaproteobacteria bacterium]MBW2116830.1 TrkH family potassium uptake protein [Deltaproteobacteria bacterium]MBW2342856.1 TrkH family potassium uptake protein [Deltaproteobacteria bacterium]